MSLQSKLECLYRWTLFTPPHHARSGMPYLASSPREKSFVMDWVTSGAPDKELVGWTKKMWWVIWTRQFRVNFTGMWKKRMEKEDRKAEKAEIKKKEKEDRERREALKRRMVWEVMMSRLGVVNEMLGMDGTQRGVSVEVEAA